MKNRAEGTDDALVADERLNLEHIMSLRNSAALGVG